jgi:hypothetical protein
MKALSATTAVDVSIRTFKVEVPDEQLSDLRRRIAATRWPEKETVADASQGVQLATMQKVMRYWGTEYDFRRFEARLNALPQFITEIDGHDIHFIHVRSPHKKALPLIITHGCPGSVFEMLNVIEEGRLWGTLSVFDVKKRPAQRPHGARRRRQRRFRRMVHPDPDTSG